MSLDVTRLLLYDIKDHVQQETDGLAQTGECGRFKGLFTRSP